MTSVIVLIAIVAVCVLFLFWCIKNANNIKFKKEKKPKDKKSAEEKFKDVIPKEKVKKEPVIKESVKKDLKKESSANSSVSKITKEDFTNNDMTIPTALLSDTEKTEKAKEIARQGKPAQPKGFDFNFDNEFNQMKPPLGDNPFKFDDELDSLLSSAKKQSPLPKFEPLPKPKFDVIDDELDFDPFEEPEINSNKDGFDGATFSDRFNKVFGESKNKKDAKNEVILGDVVSQPRARVNRLNRRKYF